jgi:glutamyl-tRNA reductase
MSAAMKRVKKRIFPVGLFIENEQCLVVGGGKIATRKVLLLLDAGAAITIMAPEITTALNDLHLQKKIIWITGEFRSDSISRFKLVYCATNNSFVNSRIMNICKDNHILCCSIDENWSEGDFLTPATIRHKDLTVSLSTGGKSCRRSRLIKDSLSKHLSFIDSANLILIGTSYQQLSLEHREHLHCAHKNYTNTGDMLCQIWGIHEFVLLNTCNRIELYLVGAYSKSLENLILRILKMDNLKSNEFYIKQGFEAFSHGVALCSGLHSQLTGENHITAQMKDATELCCKNNWAGTIMQEWMNSTLFLSREVRQTTRTFLKSDDIEGVVIDYCKAEYKNNDPKVITIIGTGMIGKTMFEKVVRAYPKAHFNWIYHRSIPQIPVICTSSSAVIPLSELSSVLKSSDIVISAVTTENFIIDSSHSSNIKQGSLYLDLSIPRAIDPDLLQHAPQLQLLDLDGIKKWYRIEQADKETLLTLCNSIINENRDIYDKLIASITGWNA